MRIRKLVAALCTMLLAALMLAPAALAADEDTTTATATAASFSVEQVYVNVPELDVYFYATDGEGNSFSPIAVQAQGVEVTVGDRKLDAGSVGEANDAICYIVALDNSKNIPQEDFHAMRTAIWKLAQAKQENDQIMVYTLAGGAKRAMDAASDKGVIFKQLRTIQQEDGAIDLAGAATVLAKDISGEYQSLAPRKQVFIATHSNQALASMALLGSTMSAQTSSINVPITTFICKLSTEEKDKKQNTQTGESAVRQKVDTTINKAQQEAQTYAEKQLQGIEDQIDGLAASSGGKVMTCEAKKLGQAFLNKQAQLAKALVLRTEVPESLGGQKQEVVTVSVPKLGSAVKSTSTVYMGFAMEKPQVSKVDILNRTTLRLTFNQAIGANADRPEYYRIASSDIWNWQVPIHSVELAEDGRSAVLKIAPIYKGNYTVSLYKVSSRITPVNLSSSRQSCAFKAARWPRDREFYFARFSKALLIALLLVGVLAVRYVMLRRRDRGAEKAAQAEHLLTNAGEADALPRRWVTLFWSRKRSIAESRWAGIVESSMILGRDPAQCDLAIQDSRIKPQHCVLSVRGEALLVQPLAPECRVYVNGEQIAGEHCLQNNDTMRIGHTTIRLVL